MSDISLYFLKTADQPSMLLVHPSHSVLFDAPPDVDVTYDPDTVFLTSRQPEVKNLS